MKFRLKRILVTPIVLMGASLEFLFFLLQNWDLFRKKTVSVFWHHSFGHTVSGLDYISRVYSPSKVGVVYLPSSGSNKYIGILFENLDFRILRTFLTIRAGGAERLRYRIIRFYAHLMSGLFDFELVSFENLYNTLHLSRRTQMMGNEELGVEREHTDLTGHVRLLREEIGARPRIPDRIRDHCLKEILKICPDFVRKNKVTICLRKKKGTADFVGAIRDCPNQKNYDLLVREFVKNNFLVFGTGETEHSLFSGIDGYYSLNLTSLDPKLLNVFLLAECDIFVGQHSGPYILPASMGKLVLLTDAAPHALGALLPNNLVFFKSIVETETGLRLSLKEIFHEKRELALGYGFSKYNTKYEACSPEDLALAAKEAIETFLGRQVLNSEENLLISSFRRLPGLETRIAYEESRPPLFVLKREKNVLLSDSHMRE